MRRRGPAIGVVVGVCAAGGAVAAALGTSGAQTQTSAACLQARRHVHIVASNLPDAPPQALLSQLEVLRRPGSPTETRPTELPAGVVAWPEYIRLVHVDQDGSRFYLVPGIVVLPPACREASSPAQQRSLEAEAHAQAAGSISIELVVGSRAVGHVGYTADAIANGDAVLRVGPSSSLIAGVAPDAIASVRLSVPSAAPVSASVANNFFLAAFPAAVRGPLRVEWLKPNGALAASTEVTSPPLSEPIAAPLVEAFGVPVPPAVRRAGPKKVAEFRRGAAVAAQSGCEDCHRIDEEGNSGPGPNLTHVAGRLPRRAIERQLENPSAPMPSFKSLPKDRFRALVYFLSQLR